MFVKSLSKSIFLLISLVIITCIIYPVILWIIGQIFFAFQANGSMLYENNQLVGSELIAQPFTKDEYFQPRPSAAAYNASASASSSLAASDYALRNRVARSLGSIVKYKNGQQVGPDIEKWFHQNIYQGKPNIVAQWAKQHPSLATTHAVSSEKDIQSIFFDMWRQDHPDANLQDVPGDYVTTSASGLDPHISLQNAEFQLDRVATKWASNLKRNPVEVRNEIEDILKSNSTAAFGGIAGEPIVNVLEVNLEIRKKYGAVS